MTLNDAVYRSEIKEFAEDNGYVEGITHTLGFPVEGYTLLTLTHHNQEFMYSFILISLAKGKELYKCVFKNVITYKL